MENLLITGGLGHIGSKITNDLKNYNIQLLITFQHKDIVLYLIIEILNF